jgi:hypothetical protein
MDTIFDRNKQINWSTIIMFALGFWLSASLTLDILVIPGLATTGMMNQAGFASAGYVIYGIFNRVELLCAALVLTSCLVLNRDRQQKWSIGLASILLGIALAYTYILIPQMSGIGMQFNILETSQTMTMPASAIAMHGSYWFLEIVKIAIGSILLGLFYRQGFAKN